MTFIAPLVAWFGTIAGRLALGGGIVATIFGWLLIHDHRIRVDERKTTIAKVEEKAKELDEKGIKARASIRESGAFDRLRREYCDGC